MPCVLLLIDKSAAEEIHLLIYHIAHDCLRRAAGKHVNLFRFQS